MTKKKKKIDYWAPCCQTNPGTYIYFQAFQVILLLATLLNKGGCMGCFHSIKFHHKVSVWLQSNSKSFLQIVLKCVACQAHQATKEELM
jgi:hypothetical protein